MAKDIGNFNEDAYRKRLRILRKICGDLSQTEFARFLEVAFKQWNHYERGYPIPRETAFILYEKVPGISIDWIWFGRTGGLESGLLQRIIQCEKDVRAEELEQQRTRVLLAPVRKRIGRIDKKPKKTKT